MYLHKSLTKPIMMRCGNDKLMGKDV
jgi:hypothetical protein